MRLVGLTAVAVVSFFVVWQIGSGQGGKPAVESWRGYFIVGPGNDVTMHENPAQFYAIDASVRRKEKLRLREYTCTVEAVGGVNRYDAKRTVQTCELETLAP